MDSFGRILRNISLKDFLLDVPTLSKMLMENKKMDWDIKEFCSIMLMEYWI